MSKPNFHQYQFTVTEDVIDRNRHVNNVVYLQWMQDAAVAHSQAAIRRELYDELEATWVARSHRIEYLVPTLLNDVVEVRTWISAMRRVRCVRKYQFVRASDESMLVEGESVWVFTDLNGRPKAIPAEIKQQFPLKNA